MHALGMANDQGIPTYHIDSSNASTILPLLQLDSSDLADIQDALGAGLEVITSGTYVNFNGMSILGTIIKDPVSGSATFFISGGTNGAILAITLIVLMFI